MRQIDIACRTLLEFGILAVREALRQQDIDRCRAEAEHLHNLPSLFGEENLRRHLIYFTNDRKNYVEWIAQHRPGLQGHVRAFYAPAWERMAGVLLAAFPSEGMNPER